VIEDALKGLTRRQLEELQERIIRELRTCTVCGTEGAEAYTVSNRHAKVSMLFCKPCFERHRLPEGRAISSE
jgi:transcription elongation factor Elf1